jgi:NAD(P) transhydrogenase subunit beta
MAYGVKMTQMPEMVGLMNGLGGLASMLVGWAEFEKICKLGWGNYIVQTGYEPHFSMAVIFLAMLIGSITFTGSLYAFGKLSRLLPGKPMRFKGLGFLTNLGYTLLIVGLVGFTILAGDASQISLVRIIFFVGMALSLLAGLWMVMPIGGGDMPVVISMLNSFSGLAAAASGFVIHNSLLVVTGCLVGVSGTVLTLIMCKAMNRNILQVFLGGFGSDGEASAKAGAETITASSNRFRPMTPTIFSRPRAISSSSRATAWRWRRPNTPLKSSPKFSRTTARRCDSPFIR